LAKRYWTSATCAGGEAMARKLPGMVPERQQFAVTFLFIFVGPLGVWEAHLTSLLSHH